MNTTTMSLDGLSTTELVAGVLLHFGSRKFSEQSLYRFLRKLTSRNHDLEERLRIDGVEGHLRSAPIRRVINFLEMGKILEVSMPNPVDQYFRPRENQLQSVRQQLVKRKVLPAFEDTFRELALEFADEARTSDAV